MRPLLRASGLQRVSGIDVLRFCPFLLKAEFSEAWQGEGYASVQIRLPFLSSLQLNTCLLEKYFTGLVVLGGYFSMFGQCN